MPDDETRGPEEPEQDDKQLEDLDVDENDDIKGGRRRGVRNKP